ncbi:hypothetical protein Pmani_026135 [Petrolisthes manimaculis]|uniref:Uncharacterized protein n=1 Tax=Petrolisthes manimaculis TaxID=1843537 RepID=A0AAE1P6F1_9EUCA|nr:hypothetical protein Pmani_026135 [Petrolisthes manimaculis]
MENQRKEKVNESRQSTLWQSSSSGGCGGGDPSTQWTVVVPAPLRSPTAHPDTYTPTNRSNFKACYNRLRHLKFVSTGGKDSVVVVLDDVGWCLGGVVVKRGKYVSAFVIIAVEDARYLRRLLLPLVQLERYG